MNQKQLVNLLTPILASATATMAAKLGVDPTTWQGDVAEWLTGTMTIGLLIYNHFVHATPTQTKNP